MYVCVSILCVRMCEHFYSEIVEPENRRKIYISNIFATQNKYLKLHKSF